MEQQHEGRFGVALDVTLDLPLASAGSRALAQILDFLVLSIVQGGVAAVAAGVWFGLGIEAGSTTSGWFLAVMVLLLFCVQWGWFAAWELAWEGQTPGKRALGLRVIADDGSAAGTMAIVLRNLLRTVDFLPSGYCIGLVVMLLHPQNKRLGDLAGGTVVVAEGRRRTELRRHLPAGLDASEVVLLERWFAQLDTLNPERRGMLAGKLLARLGRVRPELVRGLPEDPVAALAALCPPDHGPT